MTLTQQIITVAAVVLGTMLTRFLPFWFFPGNKPVPDYLRYLSSVLPYAVIGLLVVYCLKDVTPTASPFGLPELLGIAVTVLLHLWRKNMLLSIAGGTIVYMLLVQFVFV